MFYKLQTLEQQDNYKKMLALVGSLSGLFSESDSPYLNYRSHENIFCKYFKADNLSREDSSTDALKDNIGIGLKTWVGRNDQKIAEFGRLRPQYEELTGIELIHTIAKYRNERIRITMNVHGLTQMIYHIVKRIPWTMEIYEIAFDMIDIEKIEIDSNRGNANNTYFSDGRHVYHFSSSKNTLYMLFDNMVLIDSFSVETFDDPFEVLTQLIPHKVTEDIDSIDIVTRRTKLKSPKVDQLCLRLYSIKPDGTKFVGEKSGLNQWNGARKDKDGVMHQRNPDELYIPYPVMDRRRKAFFPPRNTHFDLLLPDGKKIVAKVCQSDGKAIMSNPNKDLGHWLLRDVFELPIGTKVTYQMLQVFGIDSVMFTKLTDRKYSVDFCSLGEYERFYDLNDKDLDKDIDKD